MVAAPAAVSAAPAAVVAAPAAPAATVAAPPLAALTCNEIWRRREL